MKSLIIKKISNSRLGQFRTTFSIYINDIDAYKIGVTPRTCNISPFVKVFERSQQHFKVKKNMHYIINDP